MLENFYMLDIQVDNLNEHYLLYTYDLGQLLYQLFDFLLY